MPLYTAVVKKENGDNIVDTPPRSSLSQNIHPVILKFGNPLERNNQGVRDCNYLSILDLFFHFFHFVVYSNRRSINK